MKKSKITVFFMVLVMISISLISVHGYAFLGIKWEGTTPISVTYKWGDSLQGSSIIKTGFSNSISDWFNSQDKINFFYSANSNNTLSSYNESATNIYGYCEIQPKSNNRISYFTAYLNASHPEITQTNVARSVAGHELGHAMGLDHLETGIAIMNSNRDRTVIYTPKQDDINGINALYQ